MIQCEDFPRSNELYEQNFRIAFISVYLCRFQLFRARRFQCNFENVQSQTKCIILRDSCAIIVEFKREKNPEYLPHTFTHCAVVVIVHWCAIKWIRFVDFDFVADKIQWTKEKYVSGKFNTNFPRKEQYRRWRWLCCRRYLLTPSSFTVYTAMLCRVSKLCAFQFEHIWFLSQMENTKTKSFPWFDGSVVGKFQQSINIQSWTTTATGTTTATATATAIPMANLLFCN